MYLKRTGYINSHICVAQLALVCLDMIVLPILGMRRVKLSRVMVFLTIPFQCDEEYHHYSKRLHVHFTKFPQTGSIFSFCFQQFRASYSAYQETICIKMVLLGVIFSQVHVQDAICYLVRYQNRQDYAECQIPSCSLCMHQYEYS